MTNSNILRDLVRILDKNIGSLEKSDIMCCGITIAQCYAILEIGIAGDISLIDLANLLNLDKSTMSRTVNNLVNHGLVDRLIDTDNRRYISLKLSEQGQEVFTKINSIFDSYMVSVFDTIQESKKDQVMESLLLLIEAFKKTKCC